MLRQLGSICVLIAIMGVAFGSERPPTFKLKRFKENPLIKVGDAKSIGVNVNGPSLLRVPDWVKNPLGRYYLYFAHHSGDRIRLAYGNTPRGPWTIHDPGVLRLKDVPVLRGHIASPDVHVDNEKKRILMFVHGPAKSAKGQHTILSVSKNGLDFVPGKNLLGKCYFRAWQHKGVWFAVANTGLFFRSDDPTVAWTKRDERLIPFVTIDDEFGKRDDVRMRHAAVWYRGDHALIFYTRKSDVPERIMCSRVDFKGDWTEWKASDPVEVMRPEKDYEGADLPMRLSKMGPAKKREHALRDPAIYIEGGRIFLYYSIAGEHGLAGAELFIDEEGK